LAGLLCGQAMQGVVVLLPVLVHDVVRYLMAESVEPEV